MHHWTSHLGPGRRAPHPHSQTGKTSETGSIHSMQFQQLGSAGRDLLPPPPGPNREKFWEWIDSFHAISSNFGSAGRKAPLPPVTKQGKFWDWIYSFHAISSNFGSAGRKAPPPPQWPNREKFWDWIYPFHAISSNFGSAGRKAPPGSCYNVEQPWSPYYKSTLRFLPSEFLLQVTKFVNFSNTYRKLQDTGSWCRWKACRQPYHNTHYYPCYTITILDMELWNVIRSLYVYACISLSGYMTKLLVMHLEQVMSL